MRHTCVMFSLDSAPVFYMLHATLTVQGISEVQGAGMLSVMRVHGLRCCQDHVHVSIGLELLGDFAALIPHHGVVRH